MRILGPSQWLRNGFRLTSSRRWLANATPAELLILVLAVLGFLGGAHWLLWGPETNDAYAHADGVAKDEGTVVARSTYTEMQQRVPAPTARPPRRRKAWKRKRRRKTSTLAVLEPSPTPETSTGPEEKPGIRIPWKLDAARYLSAVSDIELIRRNSTGHNVRFPEYSDKSLPAFEKCSAWAGWAYVNAWREQSFDLCEHPAGAPALKHQIMPEQVLAPSAPPETVEIRSTLPGKRKRRRKLPPREGPSTDQLWREYLAQKAQERHPSFDLPGQSHQGDEKGSPTTIFWADEAWAGRNQSYFRRPIPLPKVSSEPPSIRCMQRGDVDPGHHLMLCTALPKTTLLLPQGSFPFTKCYLDHRDGNSGCNFGWGEPHRTGVFPIGSVVVPGCRVSDATKSRFDKVAGVSRKFALSIADVDPNVLAVPSTSKVEELPANGTSAPPTVYEGQGRVASLSDDKEPPMPPINESARHGPWSLSASTPLSEQSKKRGPKLKRKMPKRKKFYSLELNETLFDKMPEAIHECRHVVTQPVWFVERLDPRNIYHASEDHSHIFDSLLIMPDEMLAAFANHSVQIVFLEPQEDGLFLEFWKRLSYPNAVRFLHKDPYLPGTCLTGGAVWSMHSERSLLSLGLHGEGWRGYGRGCPSLLLQGFNRWIRDLFADRTHTAAETSVWSLAPFGRGNAIPDMTVFNHRDESPHDVKARCKLPLVRWWMDRESRSIFRLQEGGRKRHQRHTMIWLSRRTHEATSQKLTSWQSARAISAAVEECIFQRLWRLVLYRNSRQCIRTHSPAEQSVSCRDKQDHFWDLQNMESSDISYAEQIEEVAHADIIIGAHGAALTHAVHMRPGSALVELAMGGNPHYEFMVKGMGQRYFSAPLNPGNLDNLLPTVMAAMRWIEGVSAWDDGDNFSDIPCSKLGL